MDKATQVFPSTLPSAGRSDLVRPCAPSCGIISSLLYLSRLISSHLDIMWCVICCLLSAVKCGISWCMVFCDTFVLFIIYPSSFYWSHGHLRFWVLYRAKEDGPVLLVCFRKQNIRFVMPCRFLGLNLKDFEGNLMWHDRAGVTLGMGMDMDMMMTMARSHIRRYVCRIFSGKVLLHYTTGNFEKTSKVGEKSEFMCGEKTLY